MTKAHSSSILSEYMGEEEPPPFIFEDPYSIDEPEQDPYLAKQDLLDPEAPAVTVFRTMNLLELMELPDPEWLVGGFLQEDSFAVLFGAPGSTKSFWALDVALSVATGTPFHGAPVKKGQVLVANGEGLRGLKWRLEAWMLAHPEADREDIIENLRVIPDVPHLLEPHHANMLLNTAEEMHKDKDKQPLRLCIIDTWARALLGGDENSQKDAGMAVNVCESVRKITGASVMVVHHTGTDGTRERGSTALRGAADTSLMMSLEETSRIANVVVKKMKDGESGHSSLYSLKQFGHSIVLAPLSNNPVLGGQPQAVRDRDYYARKASEAKRSPF